MLTGCEFMADLHIVGQPTVSEVINLDSGKIGQQSGHRLQA